MASVFGALFGDKEKPKFRDSANSQLNAVEAQLGLMKATIQMKEKALEQLREAERQFLAENDSLRAVYLERTTEVVELRKRIEEVLLQCTSAEAIACIKGACPHRTAA